MQIQRHSLQLSSERHYQRSESEQASLRVGRVSTDAATGARRVDTLFESDRVDTATLATYSAQALRAEAARRTAPATGSPSTTSAPVSTTATDPLASLPAQERFRLELIIRLHKAITGREIRVQLLDPALLQAAAQDAAPTAAPTAAGQETAVASAGIGLEYHRRLRIDEAEQTRFSVQGQVTTRDGQTLTIGIELAMSRAVRLEQHEQLRLGARLSDPLVLNFDGTAAALSERRFRFDLDADGEPEWLPTLHGERAFLALDRNGDGRINDGRELFGALSGDGFAELARHDSDGNGFIDAGDAVFSRLRLWGPGADGQVQLLTLANRQVAAIWLGHAETEFSLTPDLQENRLGVIRSSGIYLSEQGQVGTVQQLDLSI